MKKTTTKGAKKTAIIYCRVSTGSIGNPQLVSQELAGRKYAKKAGYEVIKVISEVSSGTNPKRKGIETCLIFIEEHKVDAIFVSDVSRISRKNSEVELLQFILAEHGVALFTQDRFDVLEVMHPEVMSHNYTQMTLTQHNKSTPNKKVKVLVAKTTKMQ